MTTLAAHFRRFLLLLLPFSAACGQAPPPANPAARPPMPPDSLALWLRPRLDSAQAFRGHQVGLSLADAGTGETLFGYHEAQYFSPASTAKLLSLYAGLQLLSDSLPSLRYFSRGDTLYFQGTGDPTFLHGDVPSRRAYDFLAHRPEKLLVYCELPTPPAYGPSWAWDDFGYYFQPERGPFPVYGHTVRFYHWPGVAAAPKRPAIPERLKVLPHYFASLAAAAPPALAASLAADPDAHVRRLPLDNRFQVLPSAKKWVDEVPFRTSRALTLQLLGDTLRRRITGGQWHPRPGRDSIRTLHGLPADSLYRRMLRVSDNFLAEQLLLLCSTCVGYRDSLSTDRVIREMLRHRLAFLPDRPVWVDGSGLSRLNLLTPRTLTALLVKLHGELDEKRLLSLLAPGGGPGTLRRRYHEAGPPKTTWFWGKTGTLTHTCNLAGYLRCRSGRLLAVTFFHNNIYADDQATRNEMERLLRQLRERL